MGDVERTIMSEEGVKRRQMTRHDLMARLMRYVDMPTLRILFITVVLAHTVYAIMILLPENAYSPSTPDEPGDSTLVAPVHVERSLISHAAIHNLTADHLSGIASMRLDMFIHGITVNNKDIMALLSTTCATPWMELMTRPRPPATDPPRDYWNVLTLQPAPSTFVTLYNAAIVSYGSEKTLFFTNNKFKSERNTRTFSNHVVLSHAYGTYNVTRTNVAFCVQELY